MVSYDRIFEDENLTAEMISMKRKDMKFTEFIRDIHVADNDELGNVYVKYLEPSEFNVLIQNKF